VTTLPHRAALEQARERLAQLAEAERAFLATSPYGLDHEHDKRSGRYVVRAHVVVSMPDEMNRLAAGVLRSVHESLDELAVGLAGRPTRFPIFESLALFAQRARKAIAPMSDEAQAFLEELQPYHAIGGFRNGPLWIIQQLDSDEPPRLVPSIIGGTMGVNTQRGVSIEEEPVVTEGPFADGAIVASAKTRVVGTDPKLDMFFRPDFAIAFASHGAGRGRAAIPLLRELCEHVDREVFRVLEPQLAPARA
jgi:hypothetical protein